MAKTNREEAFGKECGEGYLWCLHCERTYKDGEYREEVMEVVNGSGEIENLKFEMCPYEGCDGDTVLDGWEWEQIKGKHPEYPEIPERGKAYAL